MRISGSVLLALVAATATAVAGPPFDPSIKVTPMGNGGYCGTQDPDPGQYLAPSVERHAGTGVLFLNRCVGGCTITTGANNAPQNQANDPGEGPGPYTFEPFPAFDGTRDGAEADAEWATLMTCVAKVYSFYNVTVTDQRPTAGAYMMGIVSGTSSTIHFMGDTGGGQLLGLSNLQCSGPLDYTTYFALADSHRAVFPSKARYLKELCNTVVHEGGHAFGLEHEFDYTDMTSACSDPMSYDVGICNPPNHFFHNKFATCGGFDQVQCVCGDFQNSHMKLKAAYGDKESTIVGKPTSAVIFPAANGMLGATVAASAGSERGVEQVELFLNGHSYGMQKGAPFTGENGQPNPAQYTFTLPGNLPNSIYDITVKATDDLGATTESEKVTATKGAACTTADSCLAGQDCQDGRCFYPPPSAEVGDSCIANESCLSGSCGAPTEDGDKICTEACRTAGEETCPTGTECVTPDDQTDPAKGICYTVPEDTGCCSAGERGALRTSVIALLVGGLLVVPRRRRAR